MEANQKPRDWIEQQVGAHQFWTDKIRMEVSTCMCEHARTHTETHRNTHAHTRISQYKRNTDKFSQDQHDFCTHFKGTGQKKYLIRA